jgi:hypothetical protein
MLARLQHHRIAGIESSLVYQLRFVEFDNNLCHFPSKDQVAPRKNTKNQAKYTERTYK